MEPERRQLSILRMPCYSCVVASCIPSYLSLCFYLCRNEKWFFACSTDGRICFVVVARYEPAVKIGEKILDNVLEPIKANRKTTSIK